MVKRLIYDELSLGYTIRRLCYQLVENIDDLNNTVILGLQPKGVFLADKINHILQQSFHQSLHCGYLDITFNRDDYRRRDIDLQPKSTTIPVSLEDKKVILIDDVLYTGRSVRAALDAMLAFGRPSSVELLVLINRKYTRELPIEPKYVGKTVNTLYNEKILVELKEQGFDKDQVWLIPKHEIKIN
ncbi:MAG: bifunctional pyr operon transcriptional regulator/uracil phosphoribosyltransferase PyrR [Cytophagales bacterium]|nr:bifunctional pyr operon transcriptional regulator/uracil phosphoribosyltransferase PyrR [Cytophagales bacterium]